MRMAVNGVNVGDLSFAVDVNADGTNDVIVVGNEANFKQITMSFEL